MGQPRDKGGSKKKGSEHQDRAKGKDVVTEIFVLDRPLEDPPEHFLTARSSTKSALIF